MKLSKFTKSTLFSLSIICATSAISLSSCGFTWGDHDDDDEVVSPPKRTYDYILPYLKFGSYRSQVDNFMQNTKFFYKREADNYVFYTEGINENRIIYGYEFNPTFNRAYAKAAGMPIAFRHGMRAAVILSFGLQCIL